MSLQTGAKSWRPNPPSPVLKTIELVAICRLQPFGIVVRLPIHGPPPFVIPKAAIASLHLLSDSISSPSGHAASP